MIGGLILNRTGAGARREYFHLLGYLGEGIEVARGKTGQWFVRELQNENRGYKYDYN